VVTKRMVSIFVECGLCLLPVEVLHELGGKIILQGS